MSEIDLLRKPLVVSLLMLLAAWFSLRQALAVPLQTTLNPAAASDQKADERTASAFKMLEVAIEHERVTKNIPAISMAIVQGDQVVWSQGFGHSDERQSKPVSEHSVYRVGSVSKLFTDIAVMQLVEQGKLSLDAPVVDVLPDFHPKQEAGQPPITLRMLMSHRSGLVREPPRGNYFDDSGTSLDETVASLNDTALTYPVDSRTKYSNAGIAVVGQVVAKKLSVPFGVCIQDSILKPLGMNHSDFQFTETIRQDYCTPWMWTLDGRRFVAPNFELGMSPAGNLYSSVMDLSKFAICILNEGKLSDGQSLIKPDTLKQMTTPQSDSTGRALPFGIGFAVGKLDGHRKIGHDGAIYGCSTQLAILPDDDLAVIAVSSLDGSNGIVNRLGDYALRLMLASKQNQPLPEWTRTSPIPRDRAQELAGIYKCSDSFAEITELAGRCYLKNGAFRSELRLTADNKIVVDDVNSFGSELVPLDGGRVRIGEKEYSREADVPPPDCPAQWKDLIGEYGADHNILYVYEDHGKLWVLIEWFYNYPLTQISDSEFAFPDFGLYHGERLQFLRESDGTVSSVTAAEVAFKRRQVGTLHGETFRIQPLRPVAELRDEALKATPPVEQGDFLTTELIEPVGLDGSIRLDVRYATTNNFMGEVFYRQPRAFLQRPAAEALARVQKSLEPRGLGLLIHDAYRPWHVTKMFWEATPESMRDFVANPERGSRHNRGCAVDLTLCDLKTGNAVEMVSGYDEFSQRSFPLYPGGTSRERWYRELLRREMEAAGFDVYEFEWWHFDYRDWKKYRIGNQTFEQLLGQP
ncbi:MAG: serine hydrolase [Planctomycetaceae bacterium]|nr:serine hydrolase [Planctomycetaceae bacterium]